ncbi:MAG TPA: type II toxin-antitoxin system RelB/DinJ family antitoxin [Lachnospiraceae bacterium]|jgi:DNA-damage-inducible protein J|nr:type II toxin-antitoxin system RelB/DinJ family antitoxin [Lachnospiraceae bacterium]
MAQATFSVRMDESLKKDFDELCSEFGMTATTAFNVFARAVVRERKIPFEIQAREQTVSRENAMRAFMAIRESAVNNGVADMPLDEINAEINSARKEAGK